MSPYFDPAYFSPTYFDASAPAAAVHRRLARAPVRSALPISEDDDLLMVRLL